MDVFPFAIYSGRFSSMHAIIHVECLSVDGARTTKLCQNDLHAFVVVGNRRRHPSQLTHESIGHCILRHMHGNGEASSADTVHWTGEMGVGLDRLGYRLSDSIYCHSCSWRTFSLSRYVDDRDGTSRLFVVRTRSLFGRFTGKSLKDR